MLMLIAGCAWIGGATHEANLERWSLAIEEIGGDLSACGPTLEVVGRLSTQRAAESVTLLVDVDGQQAQDDAVVDSDGSIRWQIPLEAVEPGDLTFQLTVDTTTLARTATFLAPTERYIDADQDGFGATPTSACDPGQPVSEVPGDCDDSDPAISPDADELCTAGVDEDCDGDPLAGAIDQETFYADTDGDGFGDAAGPTSMGCVAPDHFVDDATDCDDADPQLGPPRDWYPDADTDQLGDASATPVTQCIAPPGSVADGTDCDDEDPAVGGAFVDGDGDGFGSTVPASCAAVGAVFDATDCDDTDAHTNPAQSELCDPEDRDCDGDPTAGAIDVATWYGDLDGDGFGDPDDPLEACGLPGGYTANADDCNDGNNAVNPGASDLCNGIDEDCDGAIDEDATAAELYVDGDPVTTLSEALADSTDPAEILVCGSHDWPVPTSLVSRELTFRGGRLVGSVYAVDSNLVFQGTQLVGGPGTPDAMHDLVGGALHVEGGTLTIHDSELTCDPTASIVRGGALMALMTDAPVVLSGVGISGCTTSERGGAIQVQASHLQIEAGSRPTRLEGNQSQRGGALNVQNGQLTVAADALECIDNEADLDGGAVRVINTEAIIDGHFEGNRAGRAGGAVSVEGTSDADLTGSFTANTAEEGGAVSVVAGVLGIEGATFDANLADLRGGALASNAGVQITTSTFSGNRAGPASPLDTHLGGALAIFAPDTTSLVGVELSGNTAGRGGAIAVGAGTDGVGEIDLSGVDLVDNEARSGGGMWLSGISANVLGPLAFTGNVATTGDGGGLWITESRAPADVSAPAPCGFVSGEGALSFVGNSSAGDGGGLAAATTSGVAGPGCALDLDGPATFTGNVAGADGGAISLFGIEADGSEALAYFRTTAAFSGNTAAASDGASIRVHEGWFACQSCSESTFPTPFVHLTADDVPPAPTVYTPDLQVAQPYHCNGLAPPSSGACGDSFLLAPL